MKPEWLDRSLGFAVRSSIPARLLVCPFPLDRVEWLPRVVSPPGGEGGGGGCEGLSRYMYLECSPNLAYHRLCLGPLLVSPLPRRFMHFPRAPSLFAHFFLFALPLVYSFYILFSMEPPLPAFPPPSRCHSSLHSARYVALG